MTYVQLIGNTLEAPLYNVWTIPQRNYRNIVPKARDDWKMEIEMEKRTGANAKPFRYWKKTQL